MLPLSRPRTSHICYPDSYMPPRYAYWTILIDGKPTAFRARDREELEPTFTQLARKNTDIAMKYFSRGKLWDNPEQAQWVSSSLPDAGERRTREWRPGGEHKDPRARFKGGKKAVTSRPPRDDRERRRQYEELHPAPDPNAAAQDRSEHAPQANVKGRELSPAARPAADGFASPVGPGAAPQRDGERSGSGEGDRPKPSGEWRNRDGSSKPAGDRPAGAGWRKEAPRPKSDWRPPSGDHGQSKPFGDRPKPEGEWRGKEGGAERRPYSDRPKPSGEWRDRPKTGGDSRGPGGYRGSAPKPFGDRPKYGDRSGSAPGGRPTGSRPDKPRKPR